MSYSYRARQRKSPLAVVITSNGERIGTLQPAEFMKATQPPSRTFLAAAVEKFNAYKERIGEPERATVEIVK